MSSPRRAVVVGAGVAGLATTLALELAGWRVALLERNERLRGDKAAVVIGANAVRALRVLGLGAALDAIATPVSKATLRRADGKVLAAPTALETSNALEAGPVTVHREDLFESLVAALGRRVEIHTGVTAGYVDLVHPAAGDQRRRWAADLIVGADGIGSGVRAGVDPASKVVKVGTVTFQATIPFHRAPDLPDHGAEIRDAEGRRFSYAQVGSGGLYWTATMRGGLRPEPAEVRHELLDTWFAHWQDPVRQIIAATQPAEVTQHESTCLWPLPKSYTHLNDTTGAVLVGDAAHATAPELCMGVGLALEDAVTLGACLTGKSVPEGLRAYEEQRRQRTVKLAKTSKRLGMLLGGRGRVGASMREGVLRAAPDGWLGKSAAAAWEWTPPRLS